MELKPKKAGACALEVGPHEEQFRVTALLSLCTLVWELTWRGVKLLSPPTLFDVEGGQASKKGQFQSLYTARTTGGDQREWEGLPAAGTNPAVEENNFSVREDVELMSLKLTTTLTKL